VIVERAEHPQWTSNAYLVAEGEGGCGVLIDSNGVEDPLLRMVDEQGITITHVLVTHGDMDHVARIDELAARFGVEVTRHYEGDLRSGSLELSAIPTPGHALEHYALLVDGTDCFTGDCLFKGTVGGTGNGGPNGYRNQVDSIMNKLMSLPPQTRIHPGHTLPSTIGEEWERNPFIRIWRGLDPEGDEPCLVRGEEATLILFGPDYDGTHKAWVRYPDGRDAIVGGSQITRR
jgi:glyoxylase-like metal-dependent hydrolase (beta-lactamase superfamily II)